MSRSAGEDPRAVSFVLRVRSAAQRERVDRVTVDLVSRLHDDGVRPILLKGPALTSWLYGHSSSRMYVDTDLLVSPAELPTAERCLSRLGFEESLGEQDTPGWTQRGTAWVRAADGAVVDLHSSLPGVGVPPARLWSMLGARTETISVCGMEVATLSEPARAFHVGLHAAQHGTAYPKPLEDLARALERVDRPAWEQAAALARRLEADAAFAAGLRLHPAGEALADALQLPSKYPVEVALLAGEPPAGALTLEAFARTTDLRAKTGLIVRKIVPSRRFMRAWFPRARRGRRTGMILAYLYRPVWLLLKARPAWRAWQRERAARKASSPH